MYWWWSRATSESLKRIQRAEKHRERRMGVIPVEVWQERQKTGNHSNQERSHMEPSVRHFGYSRSSGLASGHVWRQRFQIASFSPFTIENSVFKKHRFQIAPLWTAFSNDSVVGDRFRCCSVDDSRIRSKKTPFSFGNGLVWTGPKQSTHRRALLLIDSR